MEATNTTTEMIEKVNTAPRTDAHVMLEAENLTKRYEDGVLALDQVSFAVKRGEVYAMLGGNGAGKTTAINLFLNFIEPTAGEARIDAIVTHKEPLRAKQKIAFVSENVMLYPNFTALQNLDFLPGWGGRRIAAKPIIAKFCCASACRRRHMTSA